MCSVIRSNIIDFGLKHTIKQTVQLEMGFWEKGLNSNYLTCYRYLYGQSKMKEKVHFTEVTRLFQAGQKLLPS